METNQRNRFQHLFKIIASSTDSEGILLNKVISLDTNTCDEETELTYSDFKYFFYVNKITSVEDNLLRLKANLIKGEKYHYIHSYGKNGKTTFNRRFIEENRSIFKCLLIDFKDFQINRIGQRHSLATKTIKFFGLLSSLFGDKLVQTIVDCIVHINNTQIEIKLDSTNNEPREEYNSLFNSVKVELLEFINNIKKDAVDLSATIKEKEAHLFNDRFEPFMNKLIEKDQVMTIDLFNLLLLVALKLYTVPEKKTVIIFDNIDDILTHSSEYLTAEILPEIDTYFTILNKYLNLKEEFIDRIILDQVSFIFTYRTANYVSSMYTVNYNLSSNYRRDNLLNAPIYVLSSVNATIDILKRKLEFYEELCDSFYIEKSPTFSTLKSVLECFDNKDNEFKHIFKLWNGNQFAFVECFKSLSLSNMDHSIIINPNISINIKRGAFLFYVIKYYCSGKDYRVIRESTLSAAFQYAFTNETGDKNNHTCNLLRLFLSFIINHNQKLNRQQYYIENNKDIFNKGVSLKNIFDKLTDFKKDGTIVYNKAMFKELFERIFYDDIDAFDYFITCAKNTDLGSDSGKQLGKKYDFSKELDIYFDNDIYNPKQENYLNSIRIFYNTNAKYFLNSVKKHFEYFSSSISQEAHPLSYNIKIFNSIPENDLFDDFEFQFTYTFNNNSILENVYNNLKQTIDITIDFYSSVVYPIYPPLQYCNESNFALDGVFFYDDVISKHITYIEKVRQGILSGNLKFEFQRNLDTTFIISDANKIDPDVLANISGRFIYWIEKYIKLFYSSFEKICDCSKSNGNPMDAHSIATRSSFRLLNNKIRAIKESNFTDLTTKIESKDDRDK